MNPTPLLDQLTKLYSPQVRAEALRYACRQYEVLVHELRQTQTPLPNAWYAAGFQDGFAAGFCFALARYRMEELLDVTHALRAENAQLQARAAYLERRMKEMCEWFSRRISAEPLPFTVRVDGAGPLHDDADAQLKPPTLQFIDDKSRPQTPPVQTPEPPPAAA